MRGTEITIRRLGVDDVADYRAIRLAALRTAPEAFGSTHDGEAERPDAAFAVRLVSSTVFGAYDGGAIVGMVGLRREEGPKDRHKAHVWGMFVRPEAQGMGVGAALMEALLAEAAEIVEQVTLTVVDRNHAAIALYEKFDFQMYGVEPRALKTASGYEDEVLMVRFVLKGWERCVITTMQMSNMGDAREP
jgi:ribosomal protein S18 acetylase RimI-like enzyme